MATGVDAMRTGHNLRDARLEAIPWLGPERLALARAQQVAIVGVGNIGGQCAQHLVLMGIPVLLIDRDVVGVENYATQGFASDVGFGKAEARARWLAPLNRNCKIDHLHADIRHLGMGALRTVSLILSCADNLPTRIAINLSALRLGIPWMDSAIDGTGRTLFGRVAVTFNGAVVLRTLLVTCLTLRQLLSTP
jgi:molybdopterin/thiamine biosynthesis adenylyltransferase